MLYIRVAISASVLLLLIGCVPQGVKPSRQANITPLDNAALNIDRIEPEAVDVASNRTWQNSRVFLENGHIIHVSASGKWSTWPEMNMWSGPEGSLMWSNLGLRGSALIAKLGHDGEPFEVGVTKTFRAQDYGMLYFMINDYEDALFNNTGSVEALVYVGGGKTRAESGASNVKVVAYRYDDKTRRGSLSASTDGDHFSLRNWMLNKIGEISSSKNVAIKAGQEPVKGGNYAVLDESMADGVMTIDFEAVW